MAPGSLTFNAAVKALPAGTTPTHINSVPAYSNMTLGSYLDGAIPHGDPRHNASTGKAYLPMSSMLNEFPGTSANRTLSGFVNLDVYSAGAGTVTTATPLRMNAFQTTRATCPAWGTIPDLSSASALADKTWEVNLSPYAQCSANERPLTYAAASADAETVATVTENRLRLQRSAFTAPDGSSTITATVTNRWGNYDTTTFELRYVPPPIDRVIVSTAAGVAVLEQTLNLHMSGASKVVDDVTLLLSTAPSVAQVTYTYACSSGSGFSGTVSGNELTLRSTVTAQVFTAVALTITATDSYLHTKTATLLVKALCPPFGAWGTFPSDAGTYGVLGKVAFAPTLAGGAGNTTYSATVTFVEPTSPPTLYLAATVYTPTSGVITIPLNAHAYLTRFAETIPATVTVTATDGCGQTATATFAVNVTWPDFGAWSGIPVDKSVDSGKSFTFTPKVGGGAGTIAYTCTVKNTGAAAVSAAVSSDGSITVTVTANCVVTVVATDETNRLSTTTSFSVVCVPSSAGAVAFGVWSGIPLPGTTVQVGKNIVFTPYISGGNGTITYSVTNSAAPVAGVITIQYTFAMASSQTVFTVTATDSASKKISTTFTVIPKFRFRVDSLTLTPYRGFIQAVPHVTILDPTLSDASNFKYEYRLITWTYNTSKENAPATLVPGVISPIVYPEVAYIALTRADNNILTERIHAIECTVSHLEASGHDIVFTSEEMSSAVYNSYNPVSIMYSGNDQSTSSSFVSSYLHADDWDKDMDNAGNDCRSSYTVRAIRDYTRSITLQQGHALTVYNANMYNDGITNSNHTEATTATFYNYKSIVPVSFSLSRVWDNNDGVDSFKMGWMNDSAEEIDLIGHSASSTQTTRTPL